MHSLPKGSPSSRCSAGLCALVPCKTKMNYVFAGLDCVVLSPKVPVHIFVWNGKLPQGATGKILKREVKQEVLESLKEVHPAKAVLMSRL